MKIAPIIEAIESRAAEGGPLVTAWFTPGSTTIGTCLVLFLSSWVSRIRM